MSFYFVALFVFGNYIYTWMEETLNLPVYFHSDCFKHKRW